MSQSNPTQDILIQQLPHGVTSNHVNCPQTNLNIHFLESGYDASKPKKLVLLFHGYPEIAFSWRRVLPVIASSGEYHVVAPDLRGFGRTTGWDASDLSQFTSTTLARDAVVFVHALGYKSVHCVVGHDFGAVAASMAALMRPDLFQRLILMSHPYKSIPVLPFGTAYGEGVQPKAPVDIQSELAALSEPRKHYRFYNSTDSAGHDWLHPEQGLKSFLRGYFHVKSADWKRNDPQPLKAWNGIEVAKMPFYYIMPLHATMPEAVSLLLKSENVDQTKAWISDEDLAVYVQEWSRTGFQGGLNWYKFGTTPGKAATDLALFAGRKIEVPTLFLSGAQDWGNYQEPGALEAMKDTCDLKGIVFVDGAGHWPQQEQSTKVAEEILRFINS
jgi:pimeloyl-ACP methyl ester carboxylesterase